MKIDERYVRQWTVPSSSGGGDYVVSELKDGSFACGCPGWTRNVAKFCPDCNSRLGKLEKQPYCWGCRKVVLNARVERIDCKHIILVRNGGGSPLEASVMDRMLGRK